MTILIPIPGEVGTMKYEKWLYEYADFWQWKYVSHTFHHGSYISGVYLNTEDATAFKLRFGL